MRAIVIGYGSIGQRHVRLLQSLNIETAVVSQRKVDFPTVFSNIAEAINIFNPQYIVISNKTNEHFETVAYLLSNHWSGKTLVEKPLFHRNITTALDPAATEIFVGYNLRFHPILQKLKQDLSGKKIVSVMVYTGQYLPSWRPERDYTLSYSARQEEGGGVLRDLSHELDYITWLFGDWVRLCAIGGHFSSLSISGADTVGVIMETQKSPLIQLQINYLDHLGRRELIVVTDECTYKADLVSGTYHCNGESELFRVNRDFTYLEQHKAVINNEFSNLCSFTQGIDIVQMIDYIEESVRIRGWVDNV